MNDAHLTFGFTEAQVLVRESVLAWLARTLPVERIREPAPEYH